MTISAGSSSSVYVVRASASASTASPQTVTARGSPALTRGATSAAEVSPQRLAMADADAYAARHPRCPHEHGKPSGQTGICPICPAHPPDPPYNEPARTGAPAIPVPTGMNRT